MDVLRSIKTSPSILYSRLFILFIFLLHSPGFGQTAPAGAAAVAQQVREPSIQLGPDGEMGITDERQRSVWQEIEGTYLGGRSLVAGDSFSDPRCTSKRGESCRNYLDLTAQLPANERRILPDPNLDHNKQFQSCLPEVPRYIAECELAVARARDEANRRNLQTVVAANPHDTTRTAEVAKSAGVVHAFSADQAIIECRRILTACENDCVRRRMASRLAWMMSTNKYVNQASFDASSGRDGHYTKQINDSYTGFVQCRSRVGAFISEAEGGLVAGLGMAEDSEKILAAVAGVAVVGGIALLAGGKKKKKKDGGDTVDPEDPTEPTDPTDPADPTDPETPIIVGPSDCSQPQNINDPVCSCSNPRHSLLPRCEGAVVDRCITQPESAECKGFTDHYCGAETAPVVVANAESTAEEAPGLGTAYCFRAVAGRFCSRSSGRSGCPSCCETCYPSRMTSPVCRENPRQCLPHISNADLDRVQTTCGADPLFSSPDFILSQQQHQEPTPDTFSDPDQQSTTPGVNTKVVTTTPPRGKVEDLAEEQASRLRPDFVGERTIAPDSSIFRVPSSDSTGTVTTASVGSARVNMFQQISRVIERECELERNKNCGPRRGIQADNEGEQ